ncbi:hypothetical protein GCM10023216_02330 [Isoptericola chiayiensis]|uniref:Uncharacterized protein n=2 Tax=Isoptericola chiayiensis TaxID=579446 RepID=A0ABP8XZT5_9MICO
MEGMSTTPSDAWRDAGLDAPDDSTSLAEELSGPASTPTPEHDAEEYHPGTPRPDLEGSADEADVVEQAGEVPLDDPDADLGDTGHDPTV